MERFNEYMNIKKYGSMSILEVSVYKYARDGIFNPAIEVSFDNEVYNNIYSQLKEYIKIKNTDIGLLILSANKLYTVDKSVVYNMFYLISESLCSLFISGRKEIRLGLRYDRDTKRIIELDSSEYPIISHSVKGRGLNYFLNTWDVNIHNRRPIIPIDWKESNNSWVSSPLLLELDTYQNLPFVTIHHGSKLEIIDPLSLLYDNNITESITENLSSSGAIKIDFDVIYSGYRSNINKDSLKYYVTNVLK